MTVDFRPVSPQRSCTKTYADYRSYKKDLAKDFNNRCGYTDCSDFWFGGINNFHIDHFIPWKKNFALRPDLKTSYSNLVYACSYVNILKSDDDETNYLDPCDVNFNDHFIRDALGRISPIAGSAQAVYMYTKLKLYLRRYQIIWMLDNLDQKIDQLDALKTLAKTREKAEKIDALLNDLYKLYHGYVRFLKAAR